MYEEVIMSGFGGQGVVSGGTVLVHAGLLEGKNVTFFPAYGAEMRGGTANCSVVVSDEQIASPVVSRPSTAIVLNAPSFTKFEPTVAEGGLLIVNKSLVSDESKRDDITVVYLPCNDIAEKIGSIRAANMVALGCFAGRTGAVSVDSIEKAMPKVFKRAKKEMLALNRKALDEGATFER
jgi:2-oxoglutarate ferredoxin oxidoreductase subunit gamma